MIILGDPNWRKTDGRSCELQFLEGDQVVAVVHGNLVRKYDIERAEIGTTVMSIILHSAGEVGFGSLPRKSHIAFWVDLPEIGRQRLGVGRIDYWKHDFSGEIHTVEMHARGALASLIDQPWKALFQGNLDEFIRSADSLTSIRCEGLESRRIKAYINAPSIYGALRLMSVSLGFVISEDSHGIGVVCRSVGRAIEDMQARPPFELREDKILSGTLEEGTPVRKRGG